MLRVYSHSFQLFPLTTVDGLIKSRAASYSSKTKLLLSGIIMWNVTELTKHFKESDYLVTPQFKALIAFLFFPHKIQIRPEHYKL